MGSWQAMTKPTRPAEAHAVADEESVVEKGPEMVAFGKRLLALRKEADLTQEGLAHAADLHWTYIGQVERSERNLSYKNVLRLARGLGVDPARLVRDAESER